MKELTLERSLMHANIVGKPSPLRVLVTVMKEFTLERSLIHVSIAQKLLPLPVPVTVMKKLTPQRSILHVTFVGKPSTVRVPITLIKKFILCKRNFMCVNTVEKNSLTAVISSSMKEFTLWKPCPCEQSVVVFHKPSQTHIWVHSEELVQL